MSTTSQKHRNFVLESMADKPITDVAGIGDTYGKRLRAQGFDKAYILLGQFLVLKKNEELFTEWLKLTCGATSNHATQSYKCLSDWCNAFL